jgi:acyl transferase domain-containing protein
LIDQHVSEIDSYVNTGTDTAIASNRISYFFDFHGISLTVNTACSASLVAVHQAVRSIQQEDSELALAGGVNICLTPKLFIACSRSGMLSKDGKCKTFDETADGYVRSEGAGVILLKSLEQAIEDGDHIYAVIKGMSSNHVGKVNAITVPSAQSQAELLVAAYENARVDPQRVTYIETHGTGTTLGDPIEIHGLKMAFEQLLKKSKNKCSRKNFCGLGSVKTNIGHLETASGIAGMIKLMLAMKYKKIPATINLNKINPLIKIKDTPFYFVEKTTDWHPLKDENGNDIPRIAGISSFGFGGSNVHMVLEEFDSAASNHQPQMSGPHLFVLSAKNKERLKVYAQKTVHYINKFLHSMSQLHEEVDLPHIAYTLQTGREAMEERLAVIASTPDELKEKLTRYCSQDTAVNDWYHGNVKNDREKRKSLINGNREEEFMHAAIVNQDLEKIARLWVLGADVDWKLLYPGAVPKRISLPTYPFERKRYWISELSQKQPGKSNRLAPLLDGISLGHSLDRGLVFRKILSGNDLILKDHQLGNRLLFPGVGFLEMACAAFSQIKNNSSFHLSHIVWLRPLFVEESKEESKKEVRVIVNEINKNLQFEIQSHNGGVPLIHSRGELSVIEETGDKSPVHDKQRISIGSIKERCPHQINKENFYQEFSNGDLSYGAYFKGVNHIWMNEKEVLSLICLPLEFEKEFTSYILHPTVMDSALHASAVLLKAPGKKDRSATMLPYSIEKLEIFHPLKKRVYAHIKKVGEKRFNIVILDDKGLVCLKIHDLIFKESKDTRSKIMSELSWLHSA